MTYDIIYFLVALIPEAVLIRAMCKVLDMRSVWRFIALRLFFDCVSFLFRYLPSTNGIIRLALFLATNVIVPFVMSRGPALTRLSRIVLVIAGGLLTEFVGASTYHLISGGEFFPSEINQDTIASVVVIYSLLAFFASIVMEFIITLYARIDRDRDAMLEPPVIFLSLVMFVGFDALLMRTNDAGVYSLMGPFLCFLCCLCTLGSCMALLAVARRDAEATRLAADQVAVARQERHVRGEIEASVQRTTQMSRLRHDLANQVEVVEQLAAQGRYDEADQYLEDLQAQARKLGGQHPSMGTRG